jgi:hypothetical protein
MHAVAGDAIANMTNSETADRRFRIDDGNK